MIKIPFGIDPEETFELDYCLALGRYEVENAEARIEQLRGKSDPAKAEETAKRLELLERMLQSAKEDLAAYVPGSGPIFMVGHIPNGKRAEIGGESLALLKIEGEVESAKRNREWAENVVRWAVRGHRNLKTASGADVAFITETDKWLGAERAVVGRKTLEAYQLVIDDLAILVLRAQRLGETGKNG